MVFRAILSNFSGGTVNSKPPTIPFGIIACTFADNLSRNSYIHEANYAGADVLSGGMHDECGGLQRQ